jgi:hypothetical protein
MGTLSASAKIQATISILVAEVVETPRKLHRQKAPTKKDPKDADRQTRWKDAIEVYSQNSPIIEKRFPVVVKPDTFISSAEKLKEVLKLKTVPHLVKTKTTSLSLDDSFKNSTGEETWISVLNFAEINYIRDTLEVEEVVVWFPEPERVEEGVERFVKRFAVVAVALMPQSGKATQTSADTSAEQETKVVSLE